jgi:hypothetical protein
MTTVAGVVFLTKPGAGLRVAARLAGEPGLTLTGGDGDSRVAAVWEAPDGASLGALAERLLAEDAELLGVFPTFVGEDEGA